MNNLQELDIEIPTNTKWDILRLDDVKSPEKRSIISGPFGSNISSKYFTKSGVPVIRGNNLSNNLGVKFRDSGFVFISPEKAEELNSWAIKDDLLFTAAGTIGQVGILTGKELYDKYTISNKQLRVRLNKNIINPYYAYYWFASPAIVDIIIQRDTGSTIPLINLGVLKSLPILLPPLQEQERIAEVLSSLDDKIDLLHRNNKTLEQLAETLFRQWFEKVENEESTTIKNIEEVATVQNGYSFKSSEFITEQPDTIEVLKMGHISAEGGLRPSPKKDFVKRDEKYNKWILNKRDIILAMTDMKDNVVILGVPALIDQDNKYVLNQRVGRIFINDGSLIENILILYMQMKDKNFISELQSKGNSGVQVNLGTDTIRQTKVVVPSKDNQRKILPKLESIFDKLDHNRNQIQQLQALRDTLLPKLMSGTVRVNE